MPLPADALAELDDMPMDTDDMPASEEITEAPTSVVADAMYRNTKL